MSHQKGNQFFILGVLILAVAASGFLIYQGNLKYQDSNQATPPAPVVATQNPPVQSLGKTPPQVPPIVEVRKEVKDVLLRLKEGLENTNYSAIQSKINSIRQKKPSIQSFRDLINRITNTVTAGQIENSIKNAITTLRVESKAGSILAALNQVDIFLGETNSGLNNYAAKRNAILTVYRDWPGIFTFIFAQKILSVAIEPPGALDTIIDRLKQIDLDSTNPLENLGETLQDIQVAINQIEALFPGNLNLVTQDYRDLYGMLDLPEITLTLVNEYELVRQPFIDDVIDIKNLYQNLKTVMAW